MPREASFTFIHETLLSKPEQTGLVVSFNTKLKFLYFSMRSPETEDLVGKYISFYVDTGKNALGWKVFSSGEGFESLEGVHEVKKVTYGKNEKVQVYVPSAIVKALKLSKPSYNKVDVETYAPAGYLKEDKYYYIKLD